MSRAASPQPPAEDAPRAEAAPAPVNAAIFYHSDGYDTSRPKLMGRHAAGEGFLNAYVGDPATRELICYAGSRAQFLDFRRRVEPLAAGRPMKWIPHTALAQLREPGCVFLPGPGVAEGAWQRRFLDQRAYSLCGVTHTICTQRVMDSLGSLLTAPAQPWDALICTSEAVKASVERLLQDYGAYLADRLGTRASAAVMLPVIPLGVDCEAFQPSAAGESWRQAFFQKEGIAEGDVVALFFGRISYHAKASPIPMYLGLEQAARKTGKRIHLILAGWFAGPSVEKGFMEAAAAMCPSVRVIHVDGRKPEIRRNVWQAAHIFTSLSDNVQETFGLTPLEAMAAGLPVVVSDWDGYRETVRDGLDGFMAPARAPVQGLGQTLALRHFLSPEAYDEYVGVAAQCTAVDVEAVAAAYARLAEDEGLRRKMGETGRRRAREQFHWPVIIGRYRELWAEMALRRKRAGREVAPRRREAPAHPMRADPFRLFANYATSAIQTGDRMELASEDTVERFRRLKELQIVKLGRDLFAADEDCERLLKHLADARQATAAALLERFPQGQRATLMRTIGWLAKMGLLRFLEAE